jgi:acyl-CoA synthetase (AMP-forming)/AMP-acid ligase II/acyl carrier protein
VTWSDFDAFRRGCPQNAFLSILLVSSECFSNHIQWFVDGRAREAGSEIPVGHVTPGLTVALVDERGDPVADGEVGEIVVASRHLAGGYWNEPELTARTFSADPGDPTVRILHTGDLGRRRPDGLFEFVGRKDHQIKLRGHRIEPGEIESALCGFSGVRDAAVVVRREDAGAPRSLVAYCELDAEGRGLLPRHLLSQLSRTLPEFMVPADLFVVEALPRLPNMKVDRDRLAELDAERQAAAGDGRGGPLLHEVTGIIETVLGVSGATPEDNLSSLGGDSLQAVAIMAELEARFGLSVPSDIFAARRNIRDLASWIAERADA